MIHIQRYFNQVAPEWDNMRRRYFSDRLAEKAINRVTLKPHMTVADIGTGTGFMAMAAAPHVKGVVGVDLAPNMLAVARRNALAAGRKNIRFLLGDAEEIPLPDEAFDVVFTNMMLHHVHNPKAAISEMARILKPGGKLVISDVDQHPFEWARQQMADIWLGFPRETILAWMAAVGLSNLEIGWSGCNCQGVSPRGEEVVVSVFIANGIK